MRSAGGALEVLVAATKLGLTSFGGPTAHIGYFREEYVVRRRWLDERTFAEFAAICQALPGPASSELGIAIGVLRAGVVGGVAAWIGFTLPSAILLVLFAYLVRDLGPASDRWLHGLRLVAVPVVALAVWAMTRALAWDRVRGAIAVAAAATALLWPTAVGQVAIITIAGLAGWRLIHPQSLVQARVALPIGRPVAVAAASLFIALLVLLPLARQAAPTGPVAIVDGFYRAGALVFGGGHVVLPILRAQVVPSGWISDELFLAGYGAAQAMPGPLFAFAAYVGALASPSPSGLLGAALALGAIFLPAFLLVAAALPAWNELRSRPGAIAALAGMSAAVVGLLAAALYTPVWTSAVTQPIDVLLVVGTLVVLARWRPPVWLVVPLLVVASALLDLVAG
jgi:chromate transporter